MTNWSLKELCAEVCNREVACLCVFLSSLTQEECIGVIF